MANSIAETDVTTRRIDAARSIVFQQSLDVIQFELWTHRIGEAAAQFLKNAARALHVDLARHLDRLIPIVASVVTHRPPERIGFLVGPLLAAPGLAAWAGSEREALLLQRLRQRLGAAAHRLDRATLRIDRAVGVAFAQCTFGFTHGVAGAAEFVEIVTLVALLAGVEPAPLHLLEQLLQLITQRLLILAQIAH